MSFDRETRGKLARVVAEARRQLVTDATDSLRRLGVQDDGTLVPLSALGGLSDAERAASGALRELLTHFTAQEPDGSDALRARSAHGRLVREIGFTTLNRLVALRMAEERGLIIESVRNGLAAAGFQLFDRVANGGLGSRAETYRAYLECLYDELAVDLPSLFSRAGPESQVFPDEATLEAVLALLNEAALADVWKEDETIGWVYQYYNDPDERKKMRDASQAPRNSRELAVRNQFFTPRYVVEFLTDNTLGRTWYEMRQAKTQLRDDCGYLVRRPTEVFLQPAESATATPDEAANLSQDELLQQPVYVPFRAKKDPRELKILDPACGSGHFLLYAFDLLETIYEEAWADETSPRPSQMRGRRLLEDYPRLDDLRAAIPGLVLRHNLHGVDIDPRAVQIAGLALWLRAQTSYQRLGLRPTDRPRLTRGNVVVAEPMPGERDLLEQFVSRLDPPLIGGLVKVVFAKMQLAGEAGTLLKIEEELREAIIDAKALWQRGPKLQQLALMPDDARPSSEQMALDLDISGITDEAFWERVEERVLVALRDFAAEATDRDATRRRLFAEDASEGLALIDVCRQRYDVILMNPPFGEATSKLLEYIATTLPSGRNDVYAAMVMRGVSLLHDNSGMLGAITSRAFVVGRDLRDFRSHLVRPDLPRLSIFLDLGGGVLDGAMVETAAYIVSAAPGSDLLYRDIRGSRSDLVAHNGMSGGFTNHESWITHRTAQFGKTADNQLFLGLTDSLVQALHADERFSPGFAEVTQGLTSEKDERFVRLRWEILPSSINSRWFVFSKGGDYSWFTSDLHLVVNRHAGGAELAAFAAQNSGNVARTRQSSKYYGSAAATYSRRSQKGFSCRRLRRGTCFSDKSGVIIPIHNQKGWLLALPIILAADYYLSLIKAQAKFGSYEVGAIKQLPRPQHEWLSVADAAEEIYALVDRIDRGIETAGDFVACHGFEFSIVAVWRDALQRVEIALNQLGLEASLTVLGFQNDRAKALDEMWTGPLPFVSYAVGVVFGLWDIRYATGERRPESTSDAFRPFPTCPPGQLQNDQGLPISRGDAELLERSGKWNYPIAIAWDGILVDFPGDAADMEARVGQALDLIPGVRREAIDYELSAALGLSLREYFRRPTFFFLDHLKRYSKSQRQAPIYWPLSTASGSYTLWVYYQRLTSDTLFTAVNRYVQPKISDVERQLREVREAHSSASGREASRLLTRIEELTVFLGELNDFRDELLRITGLPYRPNLDDGVIFNAAPLHKLFRLPKWAKDTRVVWQKLERGDYDWAHLAYTIWPDRVREKCRSDRSLAIAHDVEHLYSGPPLATGKRRARVASVAIEEDDE